MALDFAEGCAAIADLVRAGMAEHGVPGVAVAVHRAGDEYVAGFGITNVEHPMPVDGETVFQVGSTTKTITALQVLQLVEAGRLDLDTPVRRYLPDLVLATAELTASVTLRHLLTHTAGFDGDVFADFGPGDDALARAVAGMAELPAVTPIGRVWNYSNAGFTLAGRVVEVATGLTFEQACADAVLAPLGMTRSFFHATDAITYGVAAGHIVTADGPLVCRPWQLPRAVNPAGGLLSSARDQLAYARFHLGDGTGAAGTPVVQPETLAEMRLPQIAAGGGRAAHCGLSWLIQRTPGVLAHGGSTIGQESAFVMVPDERFAIVVLTNADRGAPLQRAVTRWALRELVDVVRPPAQTDVPVADLGGYAGRFRSRLADVVVTTDGADVSFTLVPPPAAPGQPAAEVPPWRVAVDGADGFQLLDGPQAGQRGEFLRDGADVQWMRIFGRVLARVPGPS